MSAQGDQQRGGRHEQEHQQTSKQGKVNALPDSRADPVQPAGPGVLSNKGGGIAGGHLGQTEQQPEPHHRRQGGGHLELVVPGQQDGVHEDLHGHEALAEDQRGGQGQQLTSAAWTCWCRLVRLRDLGKVQGAVFRRGAGQVGEVHPFQWYLLLVIRKSSVVDLRITI